MAARPRALLKWGDLTSILTEDRSRLPDLTLLRANHRLPNAAGESFAEFGHVGDNTVDAVFLRRMRIGDSVGAFAFGALVATGPLRHADEEALIWSQPVDGPQSLALGSFLPSEVGQERAAQICGVFT